MIPSARMATEIFRYPRRFKAMTAFSAVVFAALAAMLLKGLEIVPLRQPELFTAIMLTLGVSLAWCVAMFKRADDEVVLDESSIVYRVPGRPTLILQWPEIARVRARDLLQRLDLTDVTGTRRIVVAYQMENFGRLRQMIRERTTPPATAGPPRRVFARSPGSILLSLHWPLIVDTVAVDSLGWRRTIPYASVVAVRLEELKSVRDKETTGGVATVLIETTRGRTVKLAGFKDGSLALFSALEEAWKRGSAPR
jgi:hypothetical protein